MSSSDTPSLPPSSAQTAQDEVLPINSELLPLPSSEKPAEDDTPSSSDRISFSEQQPTSELVSKAQAFLESPELKENDSDSKTQFLVTKGIPAETADELQKAVSAIPSAPDMNIFYQNTS